ncbi:MAG: hypothetical protein ACK5ME_12915 [Parahaliea sp.]
MQRHLHERRASCLGTVVRSLFICLIFSFSHYCLSGSDGDAIGNFQDVDSDNDGISDLDEGLCSGNLSYEITGPVSSSGPLTDSLVEAGAGGTGMLAMNEDSYTMSFSIPGESFTAFEIRYASLSPRGLTAISVGVELEDSTIISNLDFELYFSDVNGSNSAAVDDGHAHWGNIADYTSSANNYALHAVKQQGSPFGSTDYFVQSATSANINRQSWADAAYIVPASVTPQNKIRRIILSVNNSNPRVPPLVMHSFVYVHGLSCAYTDNDGDGIPNRLDLDSDNDGCADAVEGSATFSLADLSTIPSGPDITIANGTGSSASQNLNLGTAVDASGMPSVASGGQSIGDSQLAVGPLISTQPQDQSITLGSSAVFSIAAEVWQTTVYDANHAPDYSVGISQGAPTIQWQYSDDGGVSWSNATAANMSGANTNTLTVSNNSATMVGYQFRALLDCPQNQCPLISASATLHAASSPSSGQSYPVPALSLPALWALTLLTLITALSRLRSSHQAYY